MGCGGIFEADSLLLQCERRSLHNVNVHIDEYMAVSIVDNEQILLSTVVKVEVQGRRQRKCLVLLHPNHWQ